MHNIHTKCRSLLTSAVEKTRRQADAVKDDILMQWRSKIQFSADY